MLPLLIPAAIAAASGIASAIGGGIKAGKARKKAEQEEQAEETYNNNLFNKEYYQDVLNNSDNASLLRNLREMLKSRDENAQSTAAITGATPESAAAAKETSNKAISDTMSNIAASNTRYKQNVLNRYLNQRDNLYNQRQNNNAESINSWTNLMQNGIGTAINSAGTLAASAMTPTVAGGNSYTDNALANARLAGGENLLKSNYKLPV